MHRKLMPHQVISKRFIVETKGKTGLFLAPGTGKTLIALRYTQRFVNRLIICRRDDFMTWLREMEAEGWDMDKVAIIEKGNYDTKSLIVAILIGRITTVMITYDLVKNEAITNFIKAITWKVVIADEVHLIKQWSSARTKAVIKATRHIKKRLGLTGSPITNEPLDIYSICLFIDGGKTFGQNEFRFKNRYYIKSGLGWYKRRHAKEDIGRRLKGMSIHFHEDDVLNLPPRRNVIEYCQMYPEQQRRYNQIFNEWEMELEDGKIIELDHIIVRIEKLKQIASGFYISPKDGSYNWMASGKLDKLKMMLHSDDYLGLKKKIVIWCSRTAEILKISELAIELKIGARVFWGKMSRNQRQQARMDFEQDHIIRLFIGQVDAGVGMNELKVAADAIYFSNSYKVVSRQQSERRTRRKGSEYHSLITYYDLISTNTVDYGILKGLQGSMNFANEVLNKLKKGTSLITAISPSLRAGKKIS